MYHWQNLKNKTYQQTKQKQTHRDREQTDSCRRAGRLGAQVRKTSEKIKKF